MLSPEPRGFGRPITDRDAWTRLAGDPSWSRVIKSAEKKLAEPIPDSPDSLFLDFSKTGNRTRWQRVAWRRRGRVKDFVVAECLEDKGRFLRAFEQTARAICAERTWVMPAHDRSLRNFNNQAIDIDLASSHLAASLATARYLLQDRISPETRELIRENVMTRVLTPFREMATPTRRPNWWMLGTNNWNAVCLAGVTVTALATLESPADRAYYIAAAARFSHNFLKGFTPDGYCTEGVGYWNYGFGNYVTFTEAVLQATGGRVDLLRREAARLPATYGTRIEIVGRVCPAFADCGVNSRPSSQILWYVNRRLGLGIPEYDHVGPSPSGNLHEAMMRGFDNYARLTDPAPPSGVGPGLRTWFKDAGILICRPADGGPSFGIAAKGGNNHEHHNHNDVGSYVVVVGSRPVLLDPGGEVYTSRTFSRRRYESNVLNSFGHPVPRVAGQLQRTGKQARGEVLESSFTETTDTLTLDIRSAYDVKALKRLERTFVYSRAGAGSFTVTDRVEFEKPSAFGTAFITLGHCMVQDDGSLFVYDVDEAVTVRLSAEGGSYTVSQERIEEDMHTPSLPLRIGVDLTRPVRSATITATITPASHASGGVSGLLRDGGFERDGWGWRLPDNSLGTLADDRASSGKRSLKITDASTTAGSNVTSARVAASPGPHVLTGKVFRVSGDGLGMYVKFFDADGEQLNDANEKGWIESVGSLGGAIGRWADFSFPFEAPPRTARLEVWIHSYSSARIEAYLDDLAVRRR